MYVVGNREAQGHIVTNEIYSKWKNKNHIVIHLLKLATSTEYKKDMF